MQVHNSTIADDSLTIKANQSIGEVTVIYKKEEAGMDMVIRMPKCYPLRAVDIDCTRRLGISETRLRKWMLSMASFLRNQVFVTSTEVADDVVCMKCYSH